MSPDEKFSAEDRPADSPCVRSSRTTSIAYLTLGVLALCGAGYNVGVLIAGDVSKGLDVIGPARIAVDHPDRTKPLEVAFRLRNPTSHPIRIVDVETDCRCTTGSLSGRDVPPGESVELTARVDSFDTYQNEFDHRIAVQTTDGPLELRVAGTIAPEREVLVSPRLLHLERDADGEWPGRMVRLRVPKGCARDPVAVEVRPLLLGTTGFDVVEEPPSGPYRNYVIHILTSPDPGPRTGRMRGGCKSRLAARPWRSPSGSPTASPRRADPVRLKILATLCLLACPTASHADRDGDALARRFLDHMDAVAPVAGTFTISTRYDPEIRKAHREASEKWAAEAFPGKTLDHGPDAPVLRCEWAWDGTREALDTLKGSNIIEQFYKTPESTLDRMAEKNFNLYGPTQPAEWRPASFYLLGGAALWSKCLSECEFSTRDAPADAPAGAVLLIARSSMIEDRLVLDEESGRLYSHEIDLDGSPYARLAVDRVERSSDGRIFPSRAELTIFLKENPYIFMTLAAERIVFNPAEVADAMEMVLPAGTTVHDRVLKRVIALSRATPVENVLSDELASIPPPDPIPLATLPEEPPQTTVALSSSGSSGWIIGINIAVLAAIGLVLVLKGGRIWDRLRPDRP